MVKHTHKRISILSRQRTRYYIQLVLVSLLLLLLDQGTKYLVHQRHVRFSLGWFSITYATNTGSLFSLFAKYASSNTIFISMSVVALIALGFLGVYFKHSKELCIVQTLLFAGVLGNLIDRVLWGFVIDWISFWNYPVFNIADSLIVLGIAVLIYYSFIKKNNDIFLFHKT